MPPTTTMIVAMETGSNAFLPDIVVGIGVGWLTAGALALMHVVTITIAVIVYSRMLPLRRR